MIDSVLNLLFRCPHNRMTRPMTPVSKAGEPHKQSYVVCLECGRQFEYDLKAMRVGKAIDQSHSACVVPKKAAPTKKKKMGYALLTALPAALVFRAVLKRKDPSEAPRREN